MSFITTKFHENLWSGFRGVALKKTGLTDGPTGQSATRCVEYDYTTNVDFQVCIISWHRCDTPKNPHCSLAMSAEHMLKFDVFHRQW